MDVSAYILHVSIFRNVLINEGGQNGHEQEFLLWIKMPMMIINLKINLKDHLMGSFSPDPSTQTARHLPKPQGSLFPWYMNRKASGISTSFITRDFPWYGPGLNLALDHAGHKEKKP